MSLDNHYLPCFTVFVTLPCCLQSPGDTANVLCLFTCTERRCRTLLIACICVELEDPPVAGWLGTMIISMCDASFPTVVYSARLFSVTCARLAVRVSSIVGAETVAWR